LSRGRAKIPFRHHRVELARRLEVTAPAQPMLCTVAVAAVTTDGQTVASNFVQQLVGEELPPEREDRGNTLVLRRRVHEWDFAGWSAGHITAEEALAAGAGAGSGAGFFEWNFVADELARAREARRVRVLVEVSSRRLDTPQTDSHRYATYFELSINDVPVHRGLLPDHPHDTRGALSYLRGGRGAYGYLIRATIEGPLLERVTTAANGNTWRFRTAVPEQHAPHGGLTVYEADCGRFPIAPTVVVEWEQG
jgi:hypothetical protein